MKLKVFSVFDTKAETFTNPLFFNTKGMAVRWFSDMVNGGNDVIARHPSDYILYCIGDFDDQSGLMESQSPILNCGVASEFKELKPEPINLVGGKNNADVKAGVI